MKAHRLLYYSTLGLRVIKKKKKVRQTIRLWMYISGTDAQVKKDANLGYMQAARLSSKVEGGLVPGVCRANVRPRVQQR